MFMFGWDFEVDTYSRFWWWNWIKICVRTCNMNSTLGSVVPLAMFLIYEMALLFGHHMAILAYCLPWIYWKFWKYILHILHVYIGLFVQVLSTEEGKVCCVSTKALSSNRPNFNPTFGVKAQLENTRGEIVLIVTILFQYHEKLIWCEIVATWEGVQVSPWLGKVWSKNPSIWVVVEDLRFWHTSVSPTTCADH